MAEKGNCNSNGCQRGESLSHQDKDRLVEIWKKAVETQMHFNEMSVKSRQLGLTFVAASLGIAVILIAREEDFALEIMGLRVHVGVFLMLAAALALRSVRVLDLGVYHRMLRGSVTFGEDLEENCLRQIFGLNKGMTQAISHYSRYSDADVKKVVKGYRYTGKMKITAEDKIKKFYRHTTVFLCISAFLLFVFNNFEALLNFFVMVFKG